MALIHCPECGKDISDKAISCPNCGIPINDEEEMKFCKHCGESISEECIICPICGKQVEQIETAGDRNIVINNSSNASANATAINTALVGTRPKNKWVALFLCIFTICGHKFYEGKAGMGIIYFFTLGLFGIGWLLDILVLAFKPNPYYV